MSCCNDVYFWRQSVVLIADCVHSVGAGFMLTFPAVLNPAILSPNTTDIQATPDQASSIAGSQGLAGAIGFLIAPPLMQCLGRKTINILINVWIGIGFLIFALANSISALYAARIIQGLGICGVYIITIIIGEYSHPKRRGYFITSKKVFLAIGSLMCHAMDVFWTWRQIAVFAITPHILAILVTFIWPESPGFLAMKGRYSECEKSFNWLHGSGSKMKRDLDELLSAQTKRKEENVNRKQENRIKRLLKKMLRKDFVKPFIIVSLLTIIIDACGRYYMQAYIIQILVDITGDKSISVYCTVGADTLTVIALSTSCFVIKCFKRRTLLFTAGITSIVLMFTTSFLCILKSRYDIGTSIQWMIPSVILINVFIVNLGVIPTCFAIIGEIFPLEHKGLGLCTTGIVFTILYAMVLKFTPLMMVKTGIEGTFGIYAAFVLVGLVILYFILNETKDKTLQEIEDEIKGIKKPCKLMLSNATPLLGLQAK